LVEEKSKFNNINVDWDKFVDEDEEEEEKNKGLEGFDPSSMGGFPGMGGMGGMGGFPGMGGMGDMGGNKLLIKIYIYFNHV
jgi:hypothetical protein